MKFEGFDSNDFAVFGIPGLEPRMEALIARIRPKLEALGGELAPYLSALCGQEMYPHVAKHARRTVHPPGDTWVAWGPNRRGYKALPHFQVGLFGTHLFAVFAIIYESPNKAIFAESLARQGSGLTGSLPAHFFWSTDHLDPKGTAQSDMSDMAFETLARRLKDVKKAEVTCGLRIDREDPLLGDGEALEQTVKQTFETLLPLYRSSF